MPAPKLLKRTVHVYVFPPDPRPTPTQVALAMQIDPESEIVFIPVADHQTMLSEYDRRGSRRQHCAVTQGAPRRSKIFLGNNII